LLISTGWIVGALHWIVKLSTIIHFFFSSRRRHTRSYGDWSSDVCSSDLRQRQRERSPLRTRPLELRTPPVKLGHRPDDGETETRSEERRVGKECRCRWSPYQ